MAGAFEARGTTPTGAFLNAGDEVDQFVWRGQCHPEFMDDILVNF